jgi:hypothetical protein
MGGPGCEPGAPFRLRSLRLRLFGQVVLLSVSTSYRDERIIRIRCCRIPDLSPRSDSGQGRGPRIFESVVRHRSSGIQVAMMSCFRQSFAVSRKGISSGAFKLIAGVLVSFGHICAPKNWLAAARALLDWSPQRGAECGFRTGFLTTRGTGTDALIVSPQLDE